MVEPEHLTHFWGPTGTSAPLDRITVDARPGGAFSTVMVNDADGSTYPTSARYLEVSPPERLSWVEDHSGMTVTARSPTSATTAPRSTSSRPTCRRSSWTPQPRPASSPRSTASPPTWPG